MAISKKELLDVVAKKSRNGKVSCKSMLKLADQLGVTPKRVGTACNELKIRISACQLGCFE